MVPATLSTFMHRAALVVLVLGAGFAHACSTFLLEHDGGVVFGNNYDWDVDLGLIIVNKRGVAKRAEADSLGAEWTSRYGSVTVNQYGREMPHGGINERGLTIGLMWLQGTRYPAGDARRALGELEWIQYQLDNCATVDEVVASDTAVRIAPRGPAPVHFLVADSSGACAAVEFISGRTVVHRGGRMPVKGLTNGSYSSSVAALKHYRMQGMNESFVKGSSSDGRFFRIAAHTAKRVAGGADTAVARAFAALDGLAMGDYTAWSIVYDLDARCVHVKTRRRAKAKRICLRDVDFGCETPVTMLDINARAHGDIAPVMVPYTYEANRDLMVQSFAQTDFLRGLGTEEIEFNARIPETHTRCADGSGETGGVDR
jgi:hypothetical protein